MNQDIPVALLERSFGRSRPVLHAVLDYLAGHRQLLEEGPGLSKNVQLLGKALNLIGAVGVLDLMKPEQLHQVLDDYFNRPASMS